MIGKISALKLGAIPAGAALAVAAIVWAPSASAGVIYHEWNNDKTQNCLAILSGTNNAIVYSCNNHSDQQWVELGSSYPDDPTYGFAFTLSNGNGDCLGIAGGSTAGGARAIQWPCNGHADQSWYGHSMPGYPAGYQEYINAGSRDCLALDGSTNNVIQWSCNGHNDQEWAMGVAN